MFCFGFYRRRFFRFSRFRRRRFVFFRERFGFGFCVFGFFVCGFLVFFYYFMVVGCVDGFISLWLFCELFVLVSFRFAFEKIFFRVFRAGLILIIFRVFVLLCEFFVVVLCKYVRWYEIFVLCVCV